MAYQFPLEGGRINASVGGNSTSAGAGYSLISTGTLLLAGGNNITLSQNGSAITISGANSPSGSINFSASNTSANLASVTFSNANGLSFGLNAGVITASHNALTSQSNAALSASNGSFSFQTAGFSNANGVTFGTSAGSIITASVNTSYAASNHSHGNPTLNLTNISGTTASASNGVTLSLSAAAQSAQTQSVIQGVIASGSTNRTGDVSFANSNGVTFGLSNNTITASVAAGGGGGIALANSQTTFTSGTVNLLEGGGAITIASTTGQKYNFSVPATSSLSVTGALSISRNGSTVSIGAPAFSAGISTIGNTSGTSGTASNQVIFAGGNNITLSQNTGAGGNTISIIGGAGGGGGIALANSQTTFTSGTINLSAAGGALTIASGTDPSYKFSVPSVSSWSATGAISLSTNGNTVSIGAPAMIQVGMSNGGNTAGVSGVNTNGLVLAGGSNITLNQSTNSNGATVSISGYGGGGGNVVRWEYPTNGFTSIGVPVNGSLSMQHQYVPFNVVGSAAKIGASLTVATFSSATTASVNYSLTMGLYTLNGSTLSLASSGSANNGFTWNNTGTSSQYTANLTGLRQMTVPMNATLAPGEYWMAALLSSATTHTGTSNMMTMLGNNQILATGVLGVIGNSTSAGRDIYLGMGMYSVTTGALPTSIALSEINNTSASNVVRANFYNAVYSATY